MSYLVLLSHCLAAIDINGYSYGYGNGYGYGSNNMVCAFMLQSACLFVGLVWFGSVRFNIMWMSISFVLVLIKYQIGSLDIDSSPVLSVSIQFNSSVFLG